MPELPEVETIRRGLAERIVRRDITRVEVRLPKIVRGSAAAFRRGLAGRQFVAVRRRGKLLGLKVSDGEHWVLLHLKMTGQLIYRQGEQVVAGGHGWPSVEHLPNKFTHLIFYFAGGGVLYFNDMRQFGYVRLVEAERKRLVWATFGVEPLDKEWTADVLGTLLQKRTTSVKAVLLDQAAIAGLGNIYADEALWRARVRPSRRADRLSREETQRLAKAAREVLQTAVRVGGTTFSDYRTVEGAHGRFSRFLRVYDRAGRPCRRAACRAAGAVITKTRVAGRGTHFCPHCQQ